MEKRRVFRVTNKGKEKLKSLNLSQLEVDTVRMALHGSLGTEIKKRGKITRQILCDTMVKMIPFCSEIFAKQVPAVGASKEDVEQAMEEEDRQLKEDLQAVISTGDGGAPNDGHGAAVAGGIEETVCKFYKVWKCKFSRKGEEEAKCARLHPPACRSFDERGSDGCKSEPCPKGKFHREVCLKLLAGECSKKAGNCYFYHPPKLSQKIKAQQQKKKEEEERLEMTQMLEEMRSLRQAQYAQFPVQMPYPFYSMPQPVPTPANSGLKKK